LTFSLTIIGPLRVENRWQRDMMHFPRHQSCALQILEQMEKNGVLIDEEFARQLIKIFGDWTHAVKKAKRQLYWLPKFKNANPYPTPPLEQLETMTDLDLARWALER
jgi:evolutionarily conserved signaling intermediate in Toll pathway